MTNLLTYLPMFLHGTIVTLMLMLPSLLFGLVLAVGMAIGSISDNFFIKKIIAGVIFFIRGTPLLVQMFLIYYGIAQFEWVRQSILWELFKSPSSCAIISLSLNTACYTCVLLLGAIASVPQNEIAAAEAIGMPKWLALRRIVFPRAFRMMLPAYSNEVIMILKSTSLASTITLMDIMGVTQHLVSRTYDSMLFYGVAAVLYMLINFVVLVIFNLLERQFRVAQSQ
jgi:His/Glu/Gln/Arg/opine family amino acid ABC transporter permease subunit